MFRDPFGGKNKETYVGIPPYVEIYFLLLVGTQVGVSPGTPGLRCARIEINARFSYLLTVLLFAKYYQITGVNTY